jgi:uncharacterized protein (PEP-CTERM system associated)
LTTAAAAADLDWRVTPGISALAIYTDNVDQAPPGDEKGSFIAAIQPRFSISGGGAGRITLDLQYAPIVPRLSNDEGVPDANDIRHRLQAIGSAELLKDNLFVDARANAGTANTLSNRPITTNDLGASRNTSQYYSFSVSPYWRQHLSTYGDLLLRYTTDNLAYSRQASDSSSSRYDVRFDSGSEFARLPWQFAYSRQDIDYTDDGLGGGRGDQRIESYDLSATYPINRLFAINGSVGYDDNDYNSGGQDRSGPSWRVGGTWTPTPRTSLGAGYGDNYWGHSWNLDLRNRTRRTTWTLRYDEKVTTSRNVILDQQLVPLVDPFGEPIVDPLTGEVFLVAIDTPSLTNDVVVRKNLRGTVALNLRRSTVAWSLYQQEWDYQANSDQNQTDYGTRLSFTHQLTSDTSATLYGNWQRSTFDADDDANYHFWDAWLTLRHRLSDHLSGSVNVGHLQQNSDDRENRYRENRIGAYLTVTF